MQKLPQVDHSVVSTLVVIDDKFLLVQEGKPGREGLYNLPGGHVEAHETLFEAAIRETKEESGYEIELTGVVGVYQSIYSHINVSGPVFSAKVVGGKPLTSKAHPDVKWVTMEELHAMAKAGQLFTKYPPAAADHYTSRGRLPLDIVTIC
jgi:8-oxo-dGTP diphosphatase